MPQKLTTTGCFIQEESSGGKHIYIKLCFVVYKNFWQSAQWMTRA